MLDTEMAGCYGARLGRYPKNGINKHRRGKLLFYNGFRGFLA